MADAAPTVGGGVGPFHSGGPGPGLRADRCGAGARSDVFVGGLLGIARVFGVDAPRVRERRTRLV